MGRVLCAIDESPASAEAAAEAIALCRRNGGDLLLVGVVEPGGVAGPGCGERLRRRRRVDYRLAQAARMVREAGLVPDIAIRAGDPAEELRREADAVDADALFLARKRGFMSGTLTRKPRIDVLRAGRNVAQGAEGNPGLEQAA